MSLLSFIKNAAHNLATNAKGVAYEVNPFDNGKTFQTAWNDVGNQAAQRADLMARMAQARWVGVPGGDQELVIPPRFVAPAPMPTVRSPYTQGGAGMIAAPSILSQVLQIAQSHSMQPSWATSEGDVPSDLLQQVNPNDGQVSLYGPFLQGSQNPGAPGQPTMRLR